MTQGDERRCAKQPGGPGWPSVLAVGLLAFVSAGSWAIAYTCGVLHGQSAGPEPRSRIIYPPQRLALRMNHGLAAHAELPCVRCHERAADSVSASDPLLPTEAACLSCHADEIDRDQEGYEGCRLCHRGLEARVGALRPYVPGSEIPTARLRFSHQRHRAQACTDCHVGVERSEMANRSHLPTMRMCFECHAPPGLGPAVVQHPLECQACHLAHPSGQLRTRWPEGAMNPPWWMAGMHHDRDWLVRHRWIGADQGPLCAECHTENECSECHDGRVRSIRIHPGDFLTTHPAMARMDSTAPGMGRCASCHSPSRFCAECHARLGIAPIAAPDVRSAQRWHPPSTVWTSGPNLHAREAMRALTTCTACHSESDCVACHASGMGTLSPHPPGFADQCQRQLSQNPRACVACHGDLDALRARCN